MAQNGNRIIIYRDGSIIAGTHTDEIQTEVEEIEVSSPTSGQWKEHVTGRKGWHVTTNYLLMADSALRDALSIGTQYTLVVRNRAGSVTMSGTATLRSCKITAQKGSLMQGTFTFTGNGALS